MDSISEIVTLEPHPNTLKLGLEAIGVSFSDMWPAYALGALLTAWADAVCPTAVWSGHGTLS